MSEKPSPAHLPGVNSPWIRGLLAVVILLGLVTVLGWFLSPARFYQSYWVAFLFVASLSLGALFWILLHHLVGATWSVVIRRPLELMSRALPWLSMLIIPALVGIPFLFQWAGHGEPAASEHGSDKAFYLNVPFFLVRLVLYFAVWGWLAWRIHTWSVRQDHTGDPGLTTRMRKLSAPGMMLLAVTTHFAATDWIMSLDPHWYSTIFGVYFWAGCIVSSLALLTTLVVVSRSLGFLGTYITVDHLHDLGKLLFSFVIFWAYIAFSQYFLIWYADIPEETIWFIHRQQGSWNDLGWALAIGHFVVPFVVLLSRAAKRSPLVLALTSLWIVAFHYLDLYWQVMPEFYPEGAQFHWLDAITLVFVASAATLGVLWVSRSQAVVAFRDPLFANESVGEEEESLQFRNA